MIEEIIKELEVKREVLSKQIHFLDELSHSGEYIGRLAEKTSSRNDKYYFYYIPKENQGIIIKHSDGSISVTSYGNIKKKQFEGYYKIQKREEKALKLFPLTWPYLKYLISKERYFKKKHKEELLRWNDSKS